MPAVILYLAGKRQRGIQNIFDPIREDVAVLPKGLDGYQLSATAEFLTRNAEIAYRHATLLRAEPLWGTAQLAPANAEEKVR